MHTSSSAYIIQALAMGSTENCFLQVCNTTTKGTAMCTNNIHKGLNGKGGGAKLNVTDFGRVM